MLAEPSLARIPPISLYWASIKRNAQLKGTGNCYQSTDNLSSASRMWESQISRFVNNSYVVFFLLGDSLASEFYAPTFRNIKFRRRGITQKKVWREFEIKNSDVNTARPFETSACFNNAKRMCRLSHHFFLHSFLVPSSISRLNLRPFATDLYFPKSNFYIKPYFMFFNINYSVF